MPESIKPAIIKLDAVGLLCPEPVVRASHLLREMKSGLVLQIDVDDPLAELDLRVFCDRTGHKFVSVEVVDSDAELPVKRVLIRSR